MLGMTQDDLDNIFAHHALNNGQTERMKNLRALAKQLASAILDWTPSSPEQTTAIRKVQESVMWANASINLNEGPDEDSVPNRTDGL